MKKRIALPLPFLLFAICMLVFVCSIGRAEIVIDQEAPSLQQSQEGRVGDDAEEIVPKPADIKQAAAIYVFLGWIWLSIGILIFFLRLKIKEVDRLHELGFFTEHKD